jgi:diacylglycerol kinase (ATP)
MKVDLRGKNKRPMRAKLIFNPGSGSAGESPIQLMDVISEMQDCNLIPEAFLVEPGCNLPGVIQEALFEGIHMFVVCGGDGTISTSARSLAGTHATLGVIPTGTQNNTALSLGIPSNNIPAAIAILRNGRRIKVDVGLATCDKINMPFLEVCSVGLVSSLFPSADDIQHGNLARVGDLLATLVGSPPAEIHLLLDKKQEIQNFGHIVLVSNMPYIGLHYQVGSAASFSDGLLDVLFFADLSKLDLLGYVLQGVAEGKPEDPRIEHFHVRKVEIETHPDMPVMVDGTAIGEGRVQIKVWRHALAVMVAQPPPELESETIELIEPQTNDAALAGG